MPSSSAFKRFGSPSPAPNQSPDPLDDFLPESPSERAFQKPRPTSFQELLADYRPSEPVDTEVAPERARTLTLTAIGVGLLVGVLVSAIPYVYGAVSRAIPGGGSAPVVISESTVTLTSVPAGAAVYIDGKQAGQTPLSLSLPVGMHVAELRSGSISRRTPLSVEAGKIVTQHVDFGGVAATGELQISSEPTGAQVAIDGTLRGVTPLKVPDMKPGAHRITVSSGRTSVNRTVEVTAGATATVVVSVPVTVQNGWVEIDAPVDLEVFEAGQHLGTGRASRIALSAGRHTLELVNRPLAFRKEATVTVVAGRSVSLSVPMPSGTLSVSALPWAEVSVDGRSIGQTPIGNLSLSLGTHEVVWRHPVHGERRQVVFVGSEPVRLGVDWTR